MVEGGRLEDLSAQKWRREESWGMAGPECVGQKLRRGAGEPPSPIDARAGGSAS